LNDSGTPGFEVLNPILIDGEKLNLSSSGLRKKLKENELNENDLPEKVLKDAHNSIKDIHSEISKIIEDNKVGEKIRDGFRVSITGEVNAGKSSLLNLLSKREVAIVSDEAGTTRDVIETYLNLDGYPVIIADTAGIRDSKDEIEKKGIKLSLKKAENADLKLVVVDAKNVDFSDFLTDKIKKNAILVVNKSDLLEGELDPKILEIDHVLISLKKNLNIDKLITKIKDKLKNKFIFLESVS